MSSACKGSITLSSTCFDLSKCPVTDEDFYSDSGPDYEYSVDSTPEDESEEDSELFATVPMAANISEGANHVFFCSTNAVVDLYWEKDGSHLNLNDRIYEIFEANLIVSDARMADSGMYSCAAYSKTHSDKKLGEASAYLSVTSGLEVSNGKCIYIALYGVENITQFCPGLFFSGMIFFLF